MDGENLPAPGPVAFLSACGHVRHTSAGLIGDRQAGRYYGRSRESYQSVRSTSEHNAIGCSVSPPSDGPNTDLVTVSTHVFSTKEQIKSKEICTHNTIRHTNYAHPGKKKLIGSIILVHWQKHFCALVHWKTHRMTDCTHIHQKL